MVKLYISVPLPGLEGGYILCSASLSLSSVMPPELFSSLLLRRGVDGAILHRARLVKQIVSPWNGHIYAA